MSRRLYISLGILLWTSALVLVLLPSWPHLYYRLYPNTSQTLANTIHTTAQALVLPKTSVPPIAPPLPPLDPKLPTDNGLIIEKIGIRGQIHEGTDWQQILEQGIWRVPDFGTPESNQLPIILAAHRWGYLNWTTAFRTLNSFYNLPKLKTGDTITIDWNQRSYTYTVTKTETGTTISDYSAHLILYTCQLWDSPTRFFVYAQRSN